MLEVTAAAWTATVALLAGLLVLDVLIAGRRRHMIGFGEAVAWSAFYVAVALLFGVVFGLFAGWDLGAQYFAGYVVEKSLSIDNLFVFVIIVSTFAVPPEHRAKALTIGIVLALALRAALIALGAALLGLVSFVFLIFGLGLIATAIQLFRHRDIAPSVDDNLLVEIARRALPVTRTYDQGRITTRIGAHRALTPMFLVLLAIGTTDVLFALDSIPAVFGVTQHGYIVFVANAFALLGLRALFFLVSGLLDRLVYLSSGLALILAFIGAKLVLHFAHLQHNAIPEISTGVSLAVIVVLLTFTVFASVLSSRRSPSIRAHAGALRQRASVPAGPARDPTGARSRSERWRLRSMDRRSGERNPAATLHQHITGEGR